MKTLLLDKTTGLYLKDLGNWVAKPQEAYPFKSSARAVEFCIEHNLWGVQVVWEFDTGHQELILTVDDLLATKTTFLPTHI